MARWMGLAPDAFVHALVSEYRPPGKDKPLVLELEPRSAYPMNGASRWRWRWQHSIPPTPELRYSITFRTLRKN